MDKTLFETTLDQLAITVRKPIPQHELNVMRNEMFEEVDGDLVNPYLDENNCNVTHYKKIVEIRYTPIKCNDCGNSVINRKIIYQWRSKQRYWRKRCTNCKMSADPTTGKYTLSDSETRKFYERYEAAIYYRKNKNV